MSDTRITAIQIELEVSIFNDEGKLTPRPKVPPLVVFEADIPPDVLTWILSLTTKRGS